jgi:hypothetical protein
MPYSPRVEIFIAKPSIGFYSRKGDAPRARRPAQRDAPFEPRPASGRSDPARAYGQVAKALVSWIGWNGVPCGLM